MPGLAHISVRHGVPMPSFPMAFSRSSFCCVLLGWAAGRWAEEIRPVHRARLMSSLPPPWIHTRITVLDETRRASGLRTRSPAQGQEGGSARILMANRPH